MVRLSVFVNKMGEDGEVPGLFREFETLTEQLKPPRIQSHFSSAQYTTATSYGGPTQDELWSAASRRPAATQPLRASPSHAAEVPSSGAVNQELQRNILWGAVGVGIGYLASMYTSIRILFILAIVVIVGFLIMRKYQAEKNIIQEFGEVMDSGLTKTGL